MDTTIKKLTKEERENVLLVLNEFSESYKENSKALSSLTASVKDTIGKIDQHLQKPENSSQTVSPDLKRLEDSINADITKIHAAVKSIFFPEKQIQLLIEKLDKSIAILRDPLPQKMIHQHHVPKLIWITAGLFLILALSWAGWYMTSSKLDGFIANDTKYRFLKLDTGHVILQRQLERVENLYEVIPYLRDSIIRREEQDRKNLEMLQRALQMDTEGENLMREAERLKNEALKGKKKH